MIAKVSKLKGKCLCRGFSLGVSRFGFALKERQRRDERLAQPEGLG
jgi:hypothetical protein